MSTNQIGNVERNQPGVEKDL
ncbi:MAG: hypothetical protein JWR26_297, partial [Pedosphaera sp.]|nr:hypothetical protein [Pedosphaera sp.]